VIWTAAAILVVQQIDGNVVMPIVQNRAVNLPPAVALLSILLAGAVFGILGVVFAAPLAVACMVAAERLWLESGHGPNKSDAS
jgi:predicted PurR-regulated permease PerM